jgi:hypothetical protein
MSCGLTPVRQASSGATVLGPARFLCLTSRSQLWEVECTHLPSFGLITRDDDYEKAVLACLPWSASPLRDSDIQWHGDADAG